MTKKYKWKSGIPNKYVHVIGPLAGNEFTLCGDSFDIDSTDFEVESLSEGLIETTDKIDCPNCLAVIKFCKSVRL